MDSKRRAEEAFATVEPELRQLSRWMYENPEIGYQEFESSRKLSALLAKKGFAVTYPAYGLETAFEATVGSSGPRVVICCELDALPEIGHACGHNIIATAAIGAGIAVSAQAEDLGMRVTVLGTPAEETGGGKVDLIRAGAFEDTAAAMMIHPAPYDELDPSFQANTVFIVEFFGKEAHAAFAPHLGVNALDGFVQAYMNLATLRQQLRVGDTVHCIVTNGGDASNIIPSYTRSVWGVRAWTKERLSELIPKVRACFEAAALATGCRLEVTIRDHPYDNMINNPIMTALFQTNSELLGRPMPTGLEAGGGSSDMGNVSQLVPSIHPMVAIDAGGAVYHQKDFAHATVTPSGEQALRDGALAMAYTIIDLAEQGVWGKLDGSPAE
ncbi:MAG: M20 family metallopeptidase [Acidimicrobiia bacterium]